jgi:hypothetical protein
MVRFLGCMILGIAFYAFFFLYALLWDWSAFKRFDVAGLRELWNLAVGKD